MANLNLKFLTSLFIHFGHGFCWHIQELYFCCSGVLFSPSPKIYPHFYPFFKLEVMTELLHRRYTVVVFLKGGYKSITNNFLPFCFIHKMSTKYLLKLKVVGQFSHVSWMMHTFPHFCFFSRNFDLFLLGIRYLSIRNV